MKTQIRSLAGVALAGAVLCAGGAANGQSGLSPTPVMGGPTNARSLADQPARRVIPITAGKSATIDFDRDLRIGGTTNPRVADVRMVTPRNATSFVGMSAATTMTAQTVQIALEQSIQPVDAGEPVSPFKP